jgi:hypothetical protein
LCASESESTGRREGLRESESAFLFLDDQNQKYFPWKRAEDSSRGDADPVVAGVGGSGAQRAKPQVFCFPPSRLPLNIGLIFQLPARSVGGDDMRRPELPSRWLQAITKSLFNSKRDLRT